jgi:hypothetical protein
MGGGRDVAYGRQSTLDKFATSVYMNVGILTCMLALSNTLTIYFSYPAVN